jgi:hypothetical protein
MRSGSTRTAVRRSAAITRSYSSRSGWLPPAAWKMSRSSSGNRSAGRPGSGSAGPAHRGGPGTCFPAPPPRPPPPPRDPFPAGPEHDRGVRAAAQVTQLGRPAPGDQPHAWRGGERVRQDPGVDQRDLRSACGVDGDQHGQEMVGGGDPADQGQPAGGHGASQAAHAWTGVRAHVEPLGICPPAWSAGWSWRPVDRDCPPSTPVGDAARGPTTACPVVSCIAGRPA